MKNKIRKQLIGRFKKGNRTNYAVAMSATVMMVFANLVFSWLLQAVIDCATGIEGSLSLGTILIVIAALYGIMALFSLMLYHAKPKYKSKAMKQYKDYALEELSKKGITAFQGENTALYTSALSNDTSVIETKYLESNFTLVTHILLFIGAFAMMLYYSPLLTLATIGFSVLPVIATLIAGNRVAIAEKAVSDKNESYMATLKDCLTGFSVIKSFKAEVQMLALMAKSNSLVADSKCRREKVGILISTIALAAGTITQFGVFIFSAYLALSGKGITAGTIILFVQLVNFVISPISEVPVIISERKAAKALINKLADALADNVRTEGDVALTTLEKGIEVRNVTFGYEEEKTILHDVSVTFEKGKSYAVVGASGSGKSTLLNLLIAGNTGYSGEILYDDVSLRDIDSEALYELVSVIQQNVFVFNASIRDNITMFSSFPDEEVDKAAELS